MMLMDEGSKAKVYPADEFSLGFDDYLTLVKKFGPFECDLNGHWS